MELGLLFLVLSGVFTFGWMMGSALGYQNGRRDADGRQQEGHRAGCGGRGFGNFLFMGLIGILLASLANFFFKSSALNFVVSVLGVLIFTGLTAWDTQKIKNTYYAVGGDVAVAGKAAIMGALASRPSPT